MNAATSFTLEAAPGRDARRASPELTSPVLLAVRAELLRLASREDALADQEAVPLAYWATTPDAVTSHRGAARALRNRADLLLQGQLDQSA